MTYNIRYNTAADKQDAWPNRKSKVLETLQLSDAVGLQEVLKNQLDDLIHGLPDYEAFGVGRDDGKEKGEYVPILFKRDRFEKLDGGYFWLSETPAMPGSKSWDTAITRMVSWLVLKDRLQGKAFVLMNTHFDHLGQQARLESAKLVRTKAAELHPELPLVLTGDFNCNPESAPYRELTSQHAGEIHMLDTLGDYVAKEGEPAGTWNGFKAIEPNRIDFIFTARGMKHQSTKILDPKTDSGRFASDHQPVLSILEF